MNILISFQNTEPRVLLLRNNWLLIQSKTALLEKVCLLKVLILGWANFCTSLVNVFTQIKLTDTVGQ
jgi:hypothetical protein